MNNGWIMIYRKLLYSEIMINPELLQLFMYLLLNARYEKGYVTINMGRSKKLIELLPGQLLFGRDTVSSKLGQKPSSIYKRLLKLQKMEICNIESNKQFSVISILNWEEYQDGCHQVEQASNNQVTSTEQPSNKQVTQTIKNKKEKNEKNNTNTLMSSKKTKDDVVVEVLNYFNKARLALGKELGKKNLRPFKIVDTLKRQVRARLKEGYSEEDLKDVVRHRYYLLAEDKAYPGAWEYFRPSTLFNSEKFHGYHILSQEEKTNEEEKSGE